MVTVAAMPKLAVICFMAMISLIATVAVMTVIHIMTSISLSYTILHISVINAVMDVSSMKVVLPTHWEPGVGAKKYKIQFPVCSTWITQVPPHPPPATPLQLGAICWCKLGASC